MGQSSTVGLARPRQPRLAAIAPTLARMFAHRVATAALLDYWRPEDQSLPAPRRTGRVVRPATLTRAQVSALLDRLVPGPLASGWPDGRWTLERVSAIVQYELGVVLPAAALAELLRSLSWPLSPVPGQTPEPRVGLLPRQAGPAQLPPHVGNSVARNADVAAGLLPDQAARAWASAYLAPVVARAGDLAMLRAWTLTGGNVRWTARATGHRARRVRAVLAATLAELEPHRRVWRCADRARLYLALVIADHHGLDPRPTVTDPRAGSYQAYLDLLAARPVQVWAERLLAPFLPARVESDLADALLGHLSPTPALLGLASWLDQDRRLLRTARSLRLPLWQLAGLLTEQRAALSRIAPGDPRAAYAHYTAIVALTSRPGTH